MINKAQNKFINRVCVVVFCPELVSRSLSQDGVVVSSCFMRCHFDVRKIAINTFHVNSPKTCLEMFQRMMWVFETIEEEILKNSLTRLEFLKGLLHKEIELSYAGLVGRGLRFSFLKCKPNALIRLILVRCLMFKGP